MEQWSYSLALVISLAGLAVLDQRYKLALWQEARRTLKTIGIAVCIFIVWDAIGIALGIFHHGGSAYALPFRIAPEFPLEELFFLILLCYVTLLLYRGASKWQRI